MSDSNERRPGSNEDDLVRLWQENTLATPDPERVARTLMAQAWRFDQKVFWRNFREYAAGIVLMVVFAGQVALGYDRIGGAIGLVCVGFVMVVSLVDASWAAAARSGG